MLRRMVEVKNFLIIVPYVENNGYSSRTCESLFHMLRRMVEVAELASHCSICLEEWLR